MVHGARAHDEHERREREQERARPRRPFSVARCREAVQGARRHRRERGIDEPDRVERGAGREESRSADRVHRIPAALAIQDAGDREELRMGLTHGEQATREEDLGVKPLGHLVLREGLECETIDGEGCREREDEQRQNELESAWRWPQYQPNRRRERAVEPLAEHPPEADRREGDGDTHDEPFEHGRGPPGDGRPSAEQIRHRHQAERGEHDGGREWDPTRAAQGSRQPPRGGNRLYRRM